MSRIGISALSSQEPVSDLSEFRRSLERMSEAAAERGVTVQAGKFIELAEKLQTGRLTVAFCGHFSAGKSTLVNALCGTDLLPASPIPTSANVVTIVNGEPYAETVFRDAGGQVLPARFIPVEKLHEYAVDGEGVSFIRVSYPIPLLGNQMAIVDTPGVDSTDSAHRAATESALHLADVVFYVTDYNHVQSEVNFRFLRGLARWGKPTYLIVNQVDKHREEQIAFADFQTALGQSLGSWNINPEATIYLSLKDRDHPLSQWKSLLQLLRDLQPLATPLMIRSARRSAEHLVEQFREALHALSRNEREQWLSRFNEGEPEKPEELLAMRRELEEELAEIESSTDRRRHRVREEVEKLLANANLTPAETREKAMNVLKAMQPGFKPGWMASAAKTETERSLRLERLADDFNRQISANVTGHIIGILRKESASFGLKGEVLEQSLANCFKPITSEWLRDLINPGTGADGQATLYYAEKIGAELKLMYRRASLQWIEDHQQDDHAEREFAAQAVQRQLAELEQREEAVQGLARLDEEERMEERKLLELLPEPSTLANAELPLPAEISDVQIDRLNVLQSERQADHPFAVLSSRRVDEASSSQAGEIRRLGVPAGTVDRFEQAYELLVKVPALRGMAEGLKAKAERFKNRSFTIALFGAFSAGKSSFANAIVGKAALPVSPNPTTAAINRIVAPFGDNRDGTALVTMKTFEGFAEDVRNSLTRIGIGKEKLAETGNDIPRLLAMKDRITASELHPRGRPHLAFLTAASKGWDEFGSHLGKQLAVSEEQYRRFAAEEQASCFVAEIDLFVDCPITRSGAVLVDTPGADSINARHTGVAFQYIKNADAVLFVMYYNHAFTEADREFLNQLGNVKDAFELDKMFFIINAADLASSDSELEAVREHVAAQLLKHGIRNPRLFTVSSMNGLQAKQSRNIEALDASGITSFESSFRAFSEEELGGLALASANKELDRVDKLLDSWLRSANEDAASRESKALRLAEMAGQWRQEAAGNIPAATVQPLIQEIGEQLYHLRQRLKYRYKEHFQLSFHPSILQDDGRDLRKLLPACAEDLKRSIGEDLLQELRSASLRLEGTAHELALKTVSTLSGLAEMEREGFVPEPFERATLDLPLPEPFAAGPFFEPKRLWSAFRSPKHFFEQEGSTGLRDEIEPRLFNEIDDELSTLRGQWNEISEKTLLSAVSMASLAGSEQLAAFAKSMSQTLREPGEELIFAEMQEAWRKIRQ